MEHKRSGIRHASGRIRRLILLAWGGPGYAIRNLIILVLGGTLAVVLLRIAPRERRPATTVSIPAETGGAREVLPLEQILIDAANSPELGSSAIGFCLMDEKGTIILGHNADQAFIPASTLKTVTSATALEILGPEFRFTSELRTTGEIAGGIIEGDLVIDGQGDPTLSVADLHGWAQRLKEQGVMKISGRVFGDGRFFDDGIFDDFWNWGDIGNGYGSGVSGLNVNHNRFVAMFRAGAELGAPAEFLGAYPAVPDVGWINRVTTGATNSGDGVMIYGGAHASQIELRGTVPAESEAFKVTGAVPDPALYAAHHFREALRSAGIEVSESASSEGIPPAPHLLHRHESPPLIDIITHLHAVSDNHETECLFRLLGKRLQQPPDKVIRGHWKSRGLAFATLRMEDGSGLARANFICPRDLAGLQLLAASGPYGKAYRDSLLQRYDGTCRWKGGAMSGVRAYTGLARRQTGREYGFALMVNHYEDSQAVAILRESVMREVLKGELGGE